MAVEIFTSFLQITDSNLEIVSGAEVNVYAVNSTTPLTLYSNDTLVTTAANPIICDSAGRHDMRYIAAGSYKVVIKRTGAGATILTRDNIDGRIPLGGTGLLAVANGGTGAATAGAALSNLGGATAAELAAVSASVAALAGTLASTEKTHIATGTTAQRAAAPVAGDIRYNTSIGTEGVQENYDGTEWRYVSMCQPVGGFENLSIKVASNTTITVTADAVITSNGTLRQNTALSSTIDLAVQSAANGLDTATPVAIDTWYYIFAIAKPDGTTAGLASTSSSSPTMPSGYTYKKRIGAVQTIHGSATLYGTWQLGRRAQYKVGLAQTANMPSMTSGNAGSITVPTWVAVALTRFAPATATQVTVVGALSTAANDRIMIAPNNSYGAISSTSNPPLYATLPGSSASQLIPVTMLLESTNIYWANANASANTALYISGWEDNV